MTQETLKFDPTLAVEAVLKAITGRWLANHELPQAVFDLTGSWFSENGLSARVRDLRKAKYGALTVSRQRRIGKNYYEYRVTA